MIRHAWASNPESPIAVARQRVPRRYRQRHRGRLFSLHIVLTLFSRQIKYDYEKPNISPSLHLFTCTRSSVIAETAGVTMISQHLCYVCCGDIHCVSKNGTLVVFCNNLVDCQPIYINFGTVTPE